ncbi:MAG: hypothetical protein ACHQ1H_01385 [Nitrososphaerales archaeon]
MKKKRRQNSGRRIFALAVIIIVLVLTVTLVYFVSRPATVPDSFVTRVQTSQYTVEYLTQSSSTSPNALAVDSGGSVWFSLWNLSSIAVLNPSNSTLHEYPLPGVKPGEMITWGMTVDNIHRRVWFTEYSSNSIWSFDIVSNKFTQFKLSTPNSFPFGIALDNNQNVWFTELEGDKIGEITSTGTLSEISVPGSGTPEPSGITADSSGKIWFTLAGEDLIGSYYQGNFNLQNLTGRVSTPVGIAVDHKGDLWFTQHGPSLISEYNPHTHYLKTISTSNNSLISSLPYFCWVDSNGNIWFNEHQGNAMSEFFPENNTLIEYFIPTRIASEGNISYMLTSALSGAGQPWYTELWTGKIGTINTSAPLSLRLTLSNYTSEDDTITKGGSVSYGLSIGARSGVSMKAYLGNFSSQGNFSFAFAPAAGNGNFSTVLTIHNRYAAPGVFFITITARTENVAVSQIIELTVR